MAKKPGVELKVGIATLIFCILLVITLQQMGVIRKETGPVFLVQFNRIGGITKGSSVRYAGVDIGRVTGIEIKEAQSYYWDDKGKQFVWLTDDQGSPIMVDQAFISIMITNKDVFKNKLPLFTDKTEVLISTSLMGDKWIEIRPQPGKLLKQDEVLLGHPPTTIEDFIAKAEEAIDKVETAINSFNDVLGDPDIQENIKLSLENFKDLTENLKGVSETANEKIRSIADKLDLVAGNINNVVDNLNVQVSAIGGNMQEFTGTLNRIAITNENDIRVLVKNLVNTSKSMKKTLEVVEELVSRKEFSENILVTLENIKNTSEEVEGIAADIRAITSDGQIREDLKLAVSEAREAAQGANKLIKGVNSFLGVEGKEDSSMKMKKLIEINAEAEWDQESGQVSPNINAVVLPMHRSSVKLGIDSLGYDNLWNLQYRMGTGTFKPRGGVVRSKLGIGTDIDLGKSFDVFLDAYDPRDVNVDITGRILFKNDFYIHGGLRDVFDGKKPVFGAGKRF